MLMTVGMRNNAHSLNSQERIGESLLLGHYKNGKFNFGNMVCCWKRTWLSTCRTPSRFFLCCRLSQQEIWRLAGWLRFAAIFSAAAAAEQQIQGGGRIFKAKQ